MGILGENELVVYQLPVALKSLVEKLIKSKVLY